MLGIGKLGNRRSFDVAPFEHLGEVHLGNSASSVPRVVIVFGVYDQALEHALHLDFDLV